MDRITSYNVCYTKLLRIKLQPLDAEQILTLGKDLGTTMIAWSDHKLYISKMNELVQKYYMIARITPELMPDITTLASQGITKILWYSYNFV